MLDTSVLAAYLNPADVHHADAYRECVRVGAQGPVGISVITFAELMVGLLRGGAPAESVAAMLSDLALDVHPVTEAVALIAARMRADSPALKLPDALIIATAEARGAADLLTADRAWLKFSSSARLIQEQTGSISA